MNNENSKSKIVKGNIEKRVLIEKYQIFGFEKIIYFKGFIMR